MGYRCNESYWGYRSYRGYKSNRPSDVDIFVRATGYSRFIYGWHSDIFLDDFMGYRCSESYWGYRGYRGYWGYKSN